VYNRGVENKIEIRGGEMKQVEMIITTESQPGSQHILLQERATIEETAKAASRIALGAMPDCIVVGLGRVVTIRNGKAQELTDLS